MSEGVGSASLLAATSAVPVFTSLLPKFGDVRKATGNADLINDVRLGELAACGIVTAIGLTASAFSKSPIPAMVAIVTAVGLVVMYESVLQSVPKEVKS